MNTVPLILVAPGTERTGAEFQDFSISLSHRYTDAVIAGGGLPQILPGTNSRELIAELVRRSDGVLLTGGDDIQPSLYTKELSAELAEKMGPLEPERDLWEKYLIDEVVRHGKPLLCICRGLQMLNVALGGSLIVDIPTQVPGALNHKQMDRRAEPVHDVALTPDSLLAQITKEQTLSVNSTHHQAIGRVAETLKVVATSKDGVIEAVEWKDASRPFLLAVQWHPERLIDRYKVFLKLFNSFVQACASGRPN
jgi:putative glutamine amidotransferase